MLYICALPNADETGVGRVRELFTDDPAAVTAFEKSEDRQGRGVYNCVSGLAEGARRRALETIAETHTLWVDVDPKDIIESMEDVDALLGTVMLPPSRVHNSGHGRHVGYDLKEPVVDADGRAEATAVLKRLTAYLCGDPAVAHLAALLRRPGTHNTKGGGKLLCEVLVARDNRYDLFEIRDWLDDVESQPLLTRKPKPNGGDHGKDPWEEFGAEYGTYIDVESRLAEMAYRGPGSTGVHFTEFDCMNSLLGSGMLIGDAIAKVADAVMAMAKREGLTWNRTAEEVRLRAMGLSFLKKFPDVCMRHGWDQEGKPHARNQVEIIRPYVPPDMNTIPLRGWIYGKHYLRKAVTGTVSPGGVGKSALALADALAMATGRNLIGTQPVNRVKVFYWNGEEPLDELHRRIAALRVHYGIADGEIEGWLFITSGHDLALKFARSGRDGAIAFDEKVLAQLTAEIESKGIAVAIFDPLISLHSARENSNEDMDALVKRLQRVGVERDCNVEVLAHCRKGPNTTGEVTIDDMRGGSAAPDALRDVRILNKMTAAEANKAGIDPAYRGRYFQIIHAKYNYTTPRPPQWMRIVPVRLPTGEEAGAVEQWRLPGALDDTTDADADWAKAEVRKNDYRADVRAATWFGPAVAKRLGLNLHDDIQRRKVIRVIAEWLAKGVLATEIRKDKRHMPREFLMPGNGPAPQQQGDDP